MTSNAFKTKPSAFDGMDQNLRKGVVLSIYKENVAEGGSFKCTLCAGRIKQQKTKGFTNLESHFAKHHEKDIKDSVVNIKEGTNQITNTFKGTSRQQNLRKWVVGVISNNFPFTIVENDWMRKNLKIDDIFSRKTISCAVSQMYIYAREKVKNSLPPMFGIIMDGWESPMHVHYYGNLTKQKTYFLVCALQMNRMDLMQRKKI